MSDREVQWVEAEWRRLVESRPARNRRRRVHGILLLTGILAAAACFLAARGTILRAAPFTIRAIEISGNRTVRGGEILDLLSVQVGDPWWALSPRGTRMRALGDSRIASVELGYRWFHRLQVMVVEREPVLALTGHAGGEMSRDGWVLPGRAGGIQEDLPVLTIPPEATPAPGRRAGPKVAAVAGLVDRLRGEAQGLWWDLSEIELAGDDGRAFLRGCRGVILFRPGAHEELWGLVPSVLEDLRMRRQEDFLLDLRFGGRIVVRLPEPVGADSSGTSAGRGRA